jgi:AcrR family transcriptional regulator
MVADGRSQTKAEQRIATQAKLIEIARELFTKLGYAQTPTEEIVQRAGVTRGALYHHFGSKEGLFLAVLATVQQEVAQRIVEEAEQAPTLWAQLLAGCHAFLKVSLDRDVQRILLIDAPAVLGWEQWRALDAEHSMQTLTSILTALAQQGELAVASIPAATHLLSGAMNEAALWIARADNPEQALDEAGAALEQMLRGLRTAMVDGP